MEKETQPRTQALPFISLEWEYTHLGSERECGGHRKVWDTGQCQTTGVLGP